MTLSIILLLWALTGASWAQGNAELNAAVDQFGAAISADTVGSLDAVAPHVLKMVMYLVVLALVMGLALLAVKAGKK